MRFGKERLLLAATRETPRGGLKCCARGTFHPSYGLVARIGCMATTDHKEHCKMLFSVTFRKRKRNRKKAVTLIALEEGSWVAERQERERQFSLCVLAQFLNAESHDYMAYTKISNNEWEATAAGRATPWWPAAASVVTCRDSGWSFPQLLQVSVLKLLVRKWATKSVQWAQLAFENRKRNRM
nr:unnamed protein product [Rangifer tarandus platyrhynchus]